MIANQVERLEHVEPPPEHQNPTRENQLADSARAPTPVDP